MDSPGRKEAERLAAEADSAYGEQRVADAAELYAQSVQVALECDPVPRAMVARCAGVCATALVHIGQLDDALEWLQFAFEYADEEDTVAQLTLYLALAKAELGQYEQAIRISEGNLGRIERMPPGAGPGVAYALGSLATVLGEAGYLDRAADILERTRTLLSGAPQSGQYVNARDRAAVHGLRGDSDAADEAFGEAIVLARREADERLSARPFLEGLYVGLEVLVEPDSDLWRARLEAVAIARSGDYAAAAERFEEVVDRAIAVGDILTSLQCAANAIACHDQLGDVAPEELQRAAAAIRDESLAWDLSAPAALADITLVSALTNGGEANETGLDRVQLAVEAIALAELTAEHADALASQSAGRIPTIDMGIPLAFIAVEARERRAYGAAIQYFHESLRWAEDLGDAFAQVERLAALIEVVDLGDTELVIPDGAMERLRTVIESSGADDRTRFAGLLALGGRASAPPLTALADLRAAAACFERMRGRRTVSTEFEWAKEGRRLYAALLAASIRAGVSDAEAVEVLQQTRARMLLVRLAGVDEPERAAPPGAGEAVQLVARLPVPTTVVDVTATGDGVRAYLIDEHGVRHIDARGDLRSLRRVQYGDAARRAGEVVALTSSSPLLRDLVGAVEDVLEPERSLLVVLDDDLANLPIHAVPFRGRPWAESRSIGRIPAVGILRFAPEHDWDGDVLVVGDSGEDLPHAAAECAHIAGRLGGPALLGRECTFDAVSTAVHARRHDILHLALHGRGDVRRGGRASLLFADGQGGTAWAAFDDLLELPWQANLIVFSGCSTAVGGPRHGSGLYGIAQAATAAGADAVIASLWPVDDESTRVFMTAFYDELAEARKSHDWVDLRRVMDRARTMLREWLGGRAGMSAPSRDRGGRDFVFEDDSPPEPASRREEAEALHWAPFVLVGNPIVRFRRP